MLLAQHRGQRLEPADMIAAQAFGQRRELKIAVGLLGKDAAGSQRPQQAIERGAWVPVAAASSAGRFLPAAT